MAEPDRGSPEWWRDRLLKRLAERAARVELLEAYYDGNHPLPEIPQRMSAYPQARSAFLNLSKMGVTNYVPLVADAPADRLRVIGFRFGQAENVDADPVAWEIWQRNHLDADSAIVHDKALVTGQSYVLVWADEDGKAEITPEHPMQAIVAYESGKFRKRIAGLKSYIDDDDEMHRVVLYLRSEKAAFKWQRELDSNGSPHGPFMPWQPSTDESWPIALPSPKGNIPLVEFRANPSLKPARFGGGVGEFEKVIPVQNRINKTVFDRLVTAEFQAFRQRWAVGWTPENPNEGMALSMSRLLTFEDENVKVGEFGQADFSGFIKAVESDVQAMAASTRTPTFYTLGAISNISADALTALQSGLIAKTEKHRDNFSESWEEVLRLALEVEDDPRATDQTSMALWRDIEHRTWGEQVDAVLKMKSLDVPREALWQMLPNVTPQDIDRWRVMAADEALFAPADEETVANGIA